MAKIFLNSLFSGNTGPGELGPYKAFLRSAGTSLEHQLVDKPAEADLIFLSDEGGDELNDFHNTPLYRRFWSKCFIFSQCDRPIPMIPGLYASLQKRDYDLGWCRTGFYVNDYSSEYGQTRISRYSKLPFPPSPRYLCSFCGTCKSAPIRRKLKEIDHPRCRVVDTSSEAIDANTRGDQIQIKRLQTQFVDLLRDSMFSLCPRGMGTNSIRLYESMAMGRAPVILSDEWVPSREIPWNNFAIRIAERDYKMIPQILEQEEYRAQALGQTARRAWEEYFQPNVIFDRAVSIFFDIRASGRSVKWHQHQFKRLRMLPRILKCAVNAARISSGSGIANL